MPLVLQRRVKSNRGKRRRRRGGAGGAGGAGKQGATAQTVEQFIDYKPEAVGFKATRWFTISSQSIYSLNKKGGQ